MEKKADKIRFGSAILCDSAKVLGSGKVDCYGVFTSIIGYAYPCVRSWFTVFTVYNVPSETTSIVISIRAKGSKNKSSLVTIDIKEGPKPLGFTTTFQASYRFVKEGDYAIELLSLKDGSLMKIPFQVFTEPWPKFSKKELDLLRKTPGIPKAVRANVHCSKCSHAYIFEEALLPDHEYVGGVKPFPESGKLECISCGYSLELRDIQGRMRASIKKPLQQIMKG